MLIADYQEPKARPRGRTHTLNEDYFKRIGPEEAYWLGFIAADGCVTVRARHKTHQFVLSVASKDKEHLEKLRDAIGSTHQIHPTKRGVFQLIVTSYRLCKRLEALGITQRKSHTLKPPKLSRALWWHWLRGLIDGDGSFNKYWRRSRAKKKNGKGRPPTPGRYVLILSVVGSFAVTRELHRRFGGSHRLKAAVWAWSINDTRAAEILRQVYADSWRSARLDRKHQNAVRLGLTETDQWLLG